MADGALATELRRLLGERLLTDGVATQRYERDWTGGYVGSARAVALPRSTAEVAQVLQLTHAHRVPVVAQGGNTGLVGGAVPVDGAVLLSTVRLSDVEVDRTRGHVVAGAGATLEAVQQAAAAEGLVLPVDLGSRAQATLGGLVATNAGGLLAHRHGPIGRWVRGAVAVTASGQVLDRLDPPRKQSAGFELVPLLSGSEGTLAIITRLRLQLLSRTRRRVGVLMCADDLGALTERVSDLERAHGSADAVESWFAPGLVECLRRGLVRYPVDPARVCHLLAQWSGDDDDVDALLEDLLATEVNADATLAVAVDEPDLRLLWAAREMHPLLVTGRGRPVVKVDTAVQVPDRVPELRAQVEAAVRAVDAAAELFLFGHVMEGSLHVNVATSHPGPVLAAVCEAVLALDGTVSAEHGIGRLKLPWMSRMRSPQDLDAMRAIKSALDPHDLLNPGVLLPAEAQERSVLLV